MVLGAHFLPREFGGRAPLAASGLRRLKLTDAFDLVRAPLFLLFLLAASMVQASHALYYSFGSLHWRAQGIPDGVIGALWSVGVVAEIALFAASGRVIASIGTARLLMLAGACGHLALGAHGGRSAAMGDGAAKDVSCHEFRRGPSRFHPFHDPCRAGGSRRDRPRPLCCHCRRPCARWSHRGLRPTISDVCRRSLRRHGLPRTDWGGMRLPSHAALARRTGGGGRASAPKLGLWREDLASGVSETRHAVAREQQ